MSEPTQSLTIHDLRDMRLMLSHAEINQILEVAEVVYSPQNFPENRKGDFLFLFQSALNSLQQSEKLDINIVTSHVRQICSVCKKSFLGVPHSLVCSKKCNEQWLEINLHSKIEVARQASLKLKGEVV